MHNPAEPTEIELKQDALNKDGPGPWGKAPRPEKPDLEETIKISKEKFEKFFKGGGFGGGGSGGNFPGDFFASGKGMIFAAIAVFVLWLASGFFVVDAKEQAVILRFGAYSRMVSPGLNYHLPYPLETSIKIPVTVVNRVEAGMRTERVRGETPTTEDSLMLTGDENIVDINFEVQWKVSDIKNFVFNVRGPEDTVRNAAESALREIIGRTPIADALAEGRYQIQQEAQTLLQRILDSYGAGIDIVTLQLRKVDPPGAVINAFRDVQTARADRERLRNEAEAYRNDIIPRARGQAEQVAQEAEAYKQEVVAKSQGQAGRFVSVYDKYKIAKDVTKRRIYLETMSEVLQGMDKVVIDTSTQSGVVPYLPLPAIHKSVNVPAVQP